jgi:hypothetical protein
LSDFSIEIILDQLEDINDILLLAKDIVEASEHKTIEFDAEHSGLARDEYWASAHGGEDDPRVAVHIPDPNGKHRILLNRKWFQKKQRVMKPHHFKLHYLETCIHEFLHAAGHKDELVVQQKSKEIMKRLVGNYVIIPDTFQYDSSKIQKQKIKDFLESRG